MFMEKKHIIAVVHTRKKHIAASSVFTYQAMNETEAEAVAFNIAKVTDATVHQIDPTVYIIVN